MTDDTENNNVFRFGSVDGGKSESAKDEGIPENSYVVTDIDDYELFADGFLIFTPHHLAIMRDEGKGAIPVLVMPIARVKAAEIIDDDADNEPSLPL